MVQPFAHNIDYRINERDRASSMTIGPTHVYGFISVAGAGEVAIDVNFPVWFIESPGMFFGAHMPDGQSPEETHFPTISVVVLSYFTEKRGLGDYWVGAKLGIVTTGRDVGHEIVAHWHAIGKAMQNPKANTPGLDETL